ncbi:glycosyltransferase family protein [Emcibacter sp.]|uniref:glycosyltransferase family protein n=1 Tax=Emcibacter sp. TaxID=1979954 RepID=UPI002AA7A73A|nr:glycosyltransferase family protein [Emcibacter sp.]
MSELPGNNYIVATIEARMTSTRLPGKVLKHCQGKSMLALMVERVRCARHIDDVVIATTVNMTDDVIVEEANRLGVSFYRGSEDNVMSRVLEAAKFHGADIIVELTGDCPLMDPALIDEAVEAYVTGSVDYLSNFNYLSFDTSETYPIGCSVQVFKTSVLEDAFKRTDEPLDLEHVSRFIYQHQDLYNVKFIGAPESLCAPEVSITLDTPEDFQLIEAVFDNLYPSNPEFTLEDILLFLKENPEIASLNRQIGRIKV